MAKLRDVVVYLCDRYPNEQELSIDRLTMMVYLADWRSALKLQKSLTDVEWEFDYHGPLKQWITETVLDEPSLKLVRVEDSSADVGDAVEVQGDVDYRSLKNEDKELLDFVIDTAATRQGSELVRLVFSTFPAVAQERFSKLDLLSLAREYQQTAAPLLSP